MKPLVTITKLAKGHLVNLLKSHNTKSALFAVAGGGCNGLKYQLTPISEEKQLLETDIVKINDKYDLRVCKLSQLYLIGTEIDWEDNFMGQQFVFNNPNQSSSCGCGSTFSV